MAFHFVKVNTDAINYPVLLSTLCNLINDSSRKVMTFFHYVLRYLIGWVCCSASDKHPGPSWKLIISALNYF